jgi:sugar phosphate isomerase/epimerase
MKFAVSNIAWAPQDRLAAYDILTRNSIVGLEIAPGLFFAEADDPFRPNAVVLERALRETVDASLQLVSMQSFLFGVEGAELFGEPEARERLKRGMSRAIALAGELGIGNLVFGSPQQRNVPEGMAMQDALDQAANVFVAMGDEAAAVGTRIAVEFNPAAYGTNFLTRAEEAIAFVRRVDHPAVTLNFDLGAMYMNDAFDLIDTLIPAAIGIISHVHVSEPFLAPAPAKLDDAARVLSLLQGVSYERWVSIEMKQPEGGLDVLDAHVTRLVAAAQMLDNTV